MTISCDSVVLKTVNCTRRYVSYNIKINKNGKLSIKFENRRSNEIVYDLLINEQLLKIKEEESTKTLSADKKSQFLERVDKSYKIRFSTI